MTVGLHELQPKQRGIVSELHTAGSMRRRFLDMGLIEGTVVECLGRSLNGSLSAFLIRGAVIAIRARDSCEIRVQLCREDCLWG